MNMVAMSSSHLCFDGYVQRLVEQHNDLMWPFLGKDTAENTEENKKMKFKLFVYMMEKCIKRMPEGVHNIVWLVDLKDSSLSMSLVKEMKDT